MSDQKRRLLNALAGLSAAVGAAMLIVPASLLGDSVRGAITGACLGLSVVVLFKLYRERAA